MQFERHILVFLLAILAMFSPVALAQGQAPAGYNEEMIKGGGQADALSLVCGKASQSQVNAHKAGLKRRFAAKGVAPVKFDTIYDTAFNQVKAGAQANPAQMKLGCARLAKGLTAVQ